MTTNNTDPQAPARPAAGVDDLHTGPVPRAALTVLDHLARHFEVLAEVCGSVGSPAAGAYRNAAKEMREVPTSGAGWAIDLRAALAAPAPAPVGEVCDV